MFARCLRSIMWTTGGKSAGRGRGTDSWGKILSGTRQVRSRLSASAALLTRFCAEPRRGPEAAVEPSWTIATRICCKRAWASSIQVAIPENELLEITMGAARMVRGAPRSIWVLRLVGIRC